MIEIFFGILIITSFGSHNFVQCLYEDQPKILNENGTLVFESAWNRNISLKYSGRSAIKVGATNLVNVVEDAKQKHEIFSLDTDPANFQIFVDNLKSQVIGPSGIESRISAVENVTRDDNFRRGRLSRLLRRIENLERRILVLQNKLVEDNCRDAPCKNGGVCFDLYDDFLCDCSEGWQGSTCEVDVNECAFFAGTDLGCQNGALCINTFGSYRCNCTAGWVGVHCTKRETDCLSSPSAEMCGHGVCIPVRNDTGYTCLCEQGWTKDNSSSACIVDLNECDGPNPCTSACVNLPGSYTCGPCAPGYTGNGVICTDINECLLFNGGCSVQPLVPCYNTEGSYRCGQCPPGYMGDGKTCTRVDTNVCTTNNICHPQATCQQLPNSISCMCPQGMIGDGIGPNGCRPNPNPCAENLCLNGGTCVADGQSYTCMCPPGYLPPMCLRAPSPCDPNPCKNGGTCNIEDTYKFRCSCPPNFFGRFCSYDRRSCTSLIAEPSGWIKYPNNNDTYNHNERCVWVLRTNRAKVLNVTFETFNLEYSRNCVHDWLQIHDGRTSSAQLIGRFCGTDKPKGGNIISSHNELYLWFRSDNSSSRDGFSLFWNSIDPVCGGIFDAKSHGVISSPGYPGKSPPGRRCEWSITGEIGKRIHLIFFSVEANGSPSNCSEEYIAVYEGSTATGSLLGKYCERSNPDPLVSPANEVLVVMQTDNMGSDTSFQIHYSSIPGIPGCGGVFTHYHGELRSPLVQGSYPNNLLCEYLIQLPTDSTVRLEFNRFHLEETYACVDDYVEIYEGRTDQDSIGGRWCGRNYPKNYTSKSNVLLIKFRSDSLIGAEGFVIKYKIGCDASYQNNTGYIKSPNYPKPYFSRFECVYKIEAPLGHAINITSVDFQLEGNYPTCTFDYIDVFDGQRSEENPVGRFCGTKAPPTILSSHNLMEILFQTDLSNQLRGFYFSFNFVDIGCGGVLKDINGTISSPRSNDVNQFGQNVTCIWILDLPSKYTVHLKFTAFNIIDTAECATNYLEILYKSPRGVVTQRHCGSEIPPVSFYNQQTKIVYKSQVGVTGDGFEATYEGVDSKISCGGNVSAPYGVLQSPNYPEDYPGSKHCTWIIAVPLGHQVELNVHEFHLEDDCRFDYLEIRDGRTTSSPLIGKYCDVKIPPSISSYTNTMRLDFHSDSSREYPGFEIVWQETSTGCGGTLTSYEGSIVSPHYPEPINVLMQCDWKILVNHGSKLAIDVKYLDVDSSSTNCVERDYVRVYDGEDMSGGKFLTNCSAGAREDTFVTSGNQAFVRFVSDVNYTGVFHLNYTANCRQEMRSHFGIIESPNFPNDYPLNLNCEWRIIGKRGSTISISFSHFELETTWTGDCLHDKLSIIEVNRNNETIKSSDYCAERPPSFESVEETVIVKFTTDFSISKSGFRLEYRIDGCDEIFTYSGHNFYSPNYPSGAVNKDCEYFINVEYGNVITLTFQSVSFPKKRDCSSGSILIADGYNTSNILAEICQSESLAMRYTSSSNKMYMRFRADAVNNGKKFSAHYQTTLAPCGGIFTGSEGYIYSPNYPKPYDANTSCKWYVQVEEHHSIDLSFIDLQFSENSTCNDKVEILDDSENKIYQYCSGSPRPTDIIRVGNHRALVAFSSEKGTTGKGFKLYYKQNCGYSGTIRDDGIITKRPDMNNCIWSLKADEDQKIKLYFTHVQCSCSGQTNNSKCTGHEGIFVYDGDSTNAPLKVSFCKRQPPEIISTGSFITVEATKGSFLLFYDTYTSTCGGRITSLHGALATPNYPMSYPTNVECIWEVYTTPGNSIQMFFKDFEVVSNSQSCNEDYLEVRKSNEDGELLGIYCGDNRPSSFLAFEEIWVKFRSDGNFVGKGFYAEYSYAHHNEISGDFGQIMSPPLDYMHDEVEDYTYRIYVNDTNVVRLRFKQYTKGLKVYEGYDDTALEAEIDTDTNQFVSRTSYVFLRAIHSEIETFKITWMAIPKNTTDEKAMTQCGHNIISVGTAFMNFTSPNYPDNYENNLKCEWIIKSSDPSRRAAIHLHDVSVEQTNDCFADYITISESSDMENWSNERKICQIDNIESFYGTPYLKLNFVTDSSIKGKGFRAVLGTNCGSNMTDSSGVIVYDEHTSDEKNCTWTIRVNRGHLIKFKLIEKNMNQSQTCENYLSIRDGFDSSSPFLGIGKYCVNHTDEIPPTSTNRAYIKFVQTAWRHNMYWVLQYEEIREGCEETIHLTRFRPEATITTPNFPNIPKPYSECIWIVMAPYGEAVNITFVDMHLRRSSECEQEKLTLLDGATELAPEKLTVCGTARPSNFRSSQNAVYLKYTSDIPIPSNGFKLTASIAKCGYKFSYSRGTITSKNYPMLGAYPRRSVCEYLIEARYGSINITFNDIDLPMGTNVSQADHLIFYYVEVEGDSNNTKLEEALRIYGNTTTKSMLFMSKNLLIKFFSFDLNTSHRGFKLGYDITPSLCSKEYVADSAEITTPMYPERPRSDVTCTWRISVPNGRRVKVQLVDFRIDLRRPNEFLEKKSLFRFFNDYGLTSKISETSENSGVPIYSSSSVMVIQFVYSSQSNFISAKLRFTSNEPSICSADLTQRSGQIIPPAGNLPTYMCDYNFPVETNETVALIIRDVVVTGNLSRCRMNPPIRIATRPLNDRTICTNASKITVPVNSGRNYLRIMKTNLTETLSYTIDFKKHMCGGEIYDFGQGSSFGKPFFSENYGQVDCMWSFRGRRSRVQVNLTITINSPVDCDKEYIRLYGPRGRVIGTYCGNTVTEDITLPYGDVEYHADSYSPNSNFNINLKLSRGCGGIMSDRVRDIKLRKTDYTNNAECIWYILTEDSRYFLIELSFVGRFFIEDSPNCTKDYLEIRNSNNEGTDLVSKVCGRQNPAPVYTRGREIRLIFRSDNDTLGEGFTIRIERLCISSYVATDTWQNVSKPVLANSRRINCTFEITAPTDTWIQVQFNQIDLRKNENCTKENISAIVMGTRREEKISDFCDLNTRNEIWSKGKVIISYKSSLFRSFSTFEFGFRSLGCGGVINSTTVIESPKAANMRYPTNMRCRWNIKAPVGKVIIIEFKEFEYESSTGCQYDFVTIFSGSEITGRKPVARICGSLTGQTSPYTIDNNNAIIVTESDSSVNYAGFTARVKILDQCKHYVPLTFPYPPYTLNLFATTYRNDMECQVIFTTHPNNSIQIRFDQFNLKPCNSTTPQTANECSCDFVEIREGSSGTGHLIGRYCGNTIPSPITSLGDMLFLRFSTDSSGVSTGFLATVTSSPSVCGQRLLEINPNYETIVQMPESGTYLPNVRCLWHINSEQPFDIHFERFDLQQPRDDGSCADYLELSLNKRIETSDIFYQDYYSRPAYLGRLDSEKGTFRYCGNSTPSNYLSDIKQISLKFISDSIIQKTGFKLVAKTITTCFKNLTGLSGRVVIHDTVECVVHIDAPENYTITLHLFSPQGNVRRECISNFTMIYDKKTNNLLTAICAIPEVSKHVFLNASSIRMEFKNLTRSPLEILYFANNPVQGIGCGGDIYTYNGVISSPLYPENVRNYTSCQWNVRGPENSIMRLHFFEFDMGSRALCANDNIQIIETPGRGYENTTRLFCGGDVPASDIDISSGSFSVVYKKTANFDGDGWILAFQSKSNSN